MLARSGARLATLIGERRWIPASLIVGLVLVVTHGPFLGNQYVDVEPRYAEAGDELARHGLDADLDDYFSTVANPLLTSIVLGGGYRLAGESVVLTRALLLAATMALLPFLYRWCRANFDRPLADLAVVLVVVHPAVIVYSQYVGTDGLFMALSAVAMLSLVGSRPRPVVSAVTMGLALATKLLAVVLWPVVLWIFWLAASGDGAERVRAVALRSLSYFGTAALVAAPVLALSVSFQGAVLSDDFAGVHGIQFENFLVTFMSYVLWLGIFAGLSAVFWLASIVRRLGRRRSVKLVLVMLAVNAVVALVVPFSDLYSIGARGEMNLGWVEAALGPTLTPALLFGVLLIGELVLVGVVLRVMERGTEALLALWVAVPLLALSFTRPANRYVLVVLVPLIFLTIVVSRDGPRRWTSRVWLAHSGVFVAVGFYSNLFLQGRGG